MLCSYAFWMRKKTLIRLQKNWEVSGAPKRIVFIFQHNTIGNSVIFFFIAIIGV